MVYTMVRRRWREMESLRKSTYTIDDIYALPDGERAELIDGQIYDMAPPGRTHQKISWKLHQAIANYIDSNEDDVNYVEPDISVICDPSKLDEKGCHGAPDWIIEIVSESSRRMDYMIKLFKYRSAGVKEYWIVDQKKQQTIVYNFEHDTMEEYAFKEEIPVGIYNEFSIMMEF